MRVILLRHGETPGNRLHRYIGRTDEPLCAEGRAGVQAAGVFPSVTCVYVSPMLRARETAAVCFPNAMQTVLKGLREMDFGDFENRSFSDMEQDVAYRAWVDGGCTAPCPNGEGREAFTERSCTAFISAAADAARRELDDLIVVAHGGTIMAIMSRLADETQDYYHWHVPNACGYCAELRAARLTAARRFDRLPL